MTNEDKIRLAFADKDWQEIKAGDSWQIFKIMSEFVEGFEKMAKLVLAFLYLDQLELKQIINIINSLPKLQKSFAKRVTE